MGLLGLFKGFVVEVADHGSAVVLFDDIGDYSGEFVFFG